MPARRSSRADEAAALAVGDVGGYVADRLASAREGRVQAVFDRSAYAEIGGAWVCIGARLRRGPLNALVESPEAVSRWLASVAPGEAVRGTWPRFHIADATLDFARAARWHPPMPALPIDRTRLAQALARMRDAARSRIPADGLAFLIAGDAPHAALASAGHGAANALRAWLSRGYASKAPPVELRALIGLGPGLTPSGDDFLGGALAALHAFGARERARALGEWVLPLCEGATHPISVAHLAAACEGLAGEALHACLCALADGDDAAPALDAVAAVGHTSGWDALAGAVAVASAFCDD